MRTKTNKHTFIVRRVKGNVKIFEKEVKQYD